MPARLAPERDRVVGVALDDRGRLPARGAHEAGAFRCGHSGKSCRMRNRRKTNVTVTTDMVITANQKSNVSGRKPLVANW